MKEIYEIIMARLKSQVTAIKEIDFEMGQLDVLALEERPAVKFPNAFIDISYPRCDDEGAGCQIVTARVVLRLGFEVPLPTDSLADSTKRTAALSIFTTVDNTYKALQGYGTTAISPFSRVAQSPDNRYAGVKIINMVFETTFEDRTAYQA